MSKTVKYFIISIIVLSIIGFLVLLFSINSIVKSSIENIGSKMAGTAVTVDHVSISPFTGKGLISGFRVANPGDYSRDYALEVNDFSIEMDVFSLFSSKIIVYEIIITKPEIFVEQKLPENNIHAILNNIRNKYAGETTDTELVIEHFLVTDGSAEFYTEIGGERSARVEISVIELNDLGEGGGQPALEDVITVIAEHIAREALKAAAQTGGEQIRDAIQGLFN